MNQENKEPSKAVFPKGLIYKFVQEKRAARIKDWLCDVTCSDAQSALRIRDLHELYCLHQQEIGTPDEISIQTFSRLLRSLVGQQPWESVKLQRTKRGVEVRGIYLNKKSNVWSQMRGLPLELREALEE